MDISFIVPCYNASSFIQNCLDSIFSIGNRGYSFEVIVIDDKSSDNTLSVLNDYSKNHNNLIILEQPVNKRQGAARNRGIEIAKGSYIAFVDADDSIKTEGIINALNAAKVSESDICYYDFEYETSKGNWALFQLPNDIKNQILSSKDYLDHFYTPYFNAPWRTLYRKSFLQQTGIRFVEGVRWEDCDWTVRVYSKASTIQFVDGVGYRYAFNEVATSRQNSPVAMAERLYAGLRLLELSNEVQEQLPRLAQILSNEGRYIYVTDTIRIRNLSKFPVKDICRLYSESQRIDKEMNNKLLKYHWPIWESVFLSNRTLTLLLLSIVFPITKCIRTIINYVR